MTRPCHARRITAPSPRSSPSAGVAERDLSARRVFCSMQRADRFWLSWRVCLFFGFQALCVRSFLRVSLCFLFSCLCLRFETATRRRYQTKPGGSGAGSAMLAGSWKSSGLTRETKVNFGSSRSGTVRRNRLETGRAGVDKLNCLPCSRTMTIVSVLYPNWCAATRTWRRDRPSGDCQLMLIRIAAPRFGLAYP